MDAIMRRLTAWFGSLLTGLWLVAPALAQAPGTSGTAPGGGEASGPSTPMFPLIVAFGFTVVILLIVCMPSRKG